MEKKVKWMTQYAKLFEKAMKKLGRSDYKKQVDLFRNRYMDHVCSEQYELYAKYGSVILEKVYAAITYVQICLEIEISLEEAMRIWQEVMVADEQRIANGMCGLLDHLKNGYKLVANHLEKEARKHKADGSMTFEVLACTEDKLEVNISKCLYVEIFEAYGIREFGCVFCDSLKCLEKMQKSASFEKRSSLLDGECCHMSFVKR